MEEIKQLTGIYHEHQQGSLCAQHALNNLLQSEVFSADALADIARELDVEEISVLAQKPDESENMDDTGFFNIQVLQRALTMMDIELVPYASKDPIAKQARTDPETIQGYICNLGLHWYTIRRFGRQYFDLNSFLNVPDLLPNRILSHWFQIIQEKGYSIFIVHGTLPPCIADEQLTTNPVDPRLYRSLAKKLPKYIMDDKITGDSQNPRGVVRIPRDLADEYSKNPNDPNILKKIQSFIPKEFAGAGFTVIGSSPHHHTMNTDLPMDRKPVGNTKNPQKRLIVSVNLTAELMDEYEKNPNDPRILKKIQSYLPKDLIDQGYTVTVGCPPDSHYHLTDSDLPGYMSDEEFIDSYDCPHHHYHDHIMAKDSSKQKPNEQTAGNQTCSNPHPHHHPSTEHSPYNDKLPQQEQHMLGQYSPEFKIDEPYNDNPNRPQRPQHMIAQLSKQYIVDEPHSDNPNAPHQQGVVTTREIVVMSGITNKASLQAMKKLVEDNRAQCMDELNMELEREEENLLQHVLALSLVDTQKTKEHVIDPTPEDHTEMMNQLLFDEAIAASLTSTNSVEKQAEETPELIPVTTVISPSTPTVNTEPVIITNPPTLTVNTEPVIITNPPTPTVNTEPVIITNPPTPTVNTEPKMITNSSALKTINSSLPMRTPSPPPTEPDIDSLGPTIDELRQRRLQFYNNRDRSIIARPSSTLNE